MTDEKFIEKICGAGDQQFDFVFLHGLTGDRTETWQHEGTGESGPVFWPSWLCEDFPESAVYTVGYPASIFGKWAKKEMNLHERAESILEALAVEGIGTRPLAFITHSLGGILAKELLRISQESQDEDWLAIGQKTKLVCFLATPHTGAALGTVLKVFVPRLSSKHTDLLSNESGYLTALNKAYRDFVAKWPILTLAYYEMHKTNKAAIVVTAESADPGVAGTRPLAIEADHIGICKLASRDSMVYRSVRRHLTRVIAECSGLSTENSKGQKTAFTTQDYSTASTNDRRDLLQKLIDAGREHEYRQANELQNRFAQNYYRLGLYTESKQRSDAILSEVEQRFLTHVYHAKICKGAPDEEIKDALQNDVVEPICSKHTTVGEVTQATVLQALYFLTERCHIRWDK